MTSADDDFHDFVVGFVDPLTRLAFLLTAGTTPDDDARAAALSVAALAAVRRRWREVAATGAPEPLAVDALVARLPRTRRFRRADSRRVDAADTRDSRDAGPRGAPSVAEPYDPHAAFRRPANPVDREPPRVAADDAATDPVVIRREFRRAWRTLAPRQRVPLVFAEIAVASPRLTGLDVPPALGSLHRQEFLASQGFHELRAALAADDDLPSGAVALDDVIGVRASLADMLADYARQAATPVDPYARVSAQAHRTRLRTGSATVAVAAAVAVLALVVANISTSSHRTTADHAPAGSSGATLRATAAPGVASPHSLSPGSPSVASSDARAVASDPAQEAAEAAAASAEAAVPRPTDWPIRGSAGSDQTLLVGVLGAFEAEHGDLVTGPPHVVLATDTPWFRLALVVAQTPVGLIESWFYGPVGSNSLREGALGFGDSDVIAAVLNDGHHNMFVVVAPPGTTHVLLGDILRGSPLSTADQVPVDDGVLVYDMTGFAPTSIFLRVSVGAYVGWDGRVPGYTLTPTTTATTAAVEEAALGFAVRVDNGAADPVLLRRAVLAANVWAESAGRPGTAVVLWGGVGPTGNRGLVLRLHATSANDLDVVVWSRGPGQAPGARAETYQIPANAPDVPFAFAYDSSDGARVGVLAGNLATTAGLEVDGETRGPVGIDREGFASLLVGPQHGTLAEQNVAVDLFAADGSQIARIALEPSG